MKKFSLLVLLALSAFVMPAIPAMAQSTERVKPKDVQAVDDAPTASKELIPKQEKPKLETKVTTVKKGTDTVEEYRINGKLFKMRITPAKGPAYYLVDPKGDGVFIHSDGPEQKIATPTWVLLEWK
jgi:Protein of unknown function (DUF2782)